MHGEEPCVDLPMIDEGGKVVGTCRTPLTRLLSIEVHVDETGTCWTPPTAWAYAQACRVRQQKHEQVEALTAEVARLKAELEAARGEGV